MARCERTQWSSLCWLQYRWPTSGKHENRRLPGHVPSGIRFEEESAEQVRAMGERPRSRDPHDISNLLRRPDSRQHADLGERALSRRATTEACLFPQVRASRPLRRSVNLRAGEEICSRISYRLLPTPRSPGPRRRTSSPPSMGLRHLRGSTRHHLERARRCGDGRRRCGRQTRR